MNPQLIKRMAKEAGMVEGPYANGSTERIWQENREFPDALEIFASFVARECINIIVTEIGNQAKQGITENVRGLKQAISVIETNFSVDI